MRLGTTVVMICSGKTWRPAARIALVVGSLLTAVNEGSELAAGHLDIATLARVLANFAIPYVVSSLGFLSARGADSDPSAESAIDTPPQ